MSTAMTTERYQKLLALKRREDMKCALNDDLKAQYSSRGVPSQKIEREVQNFIRCAGLTEHNLNRLTRRMEKHVDKKDDDNMSTVTGVSAYSARSTMTGVSKYTESTKPAQDDAPPPGADRAVTPTKTIKAPKDELPKDTVKSGGLGVTGSKLVPITEDSPDDVIDKAEVSDMAWADLDKYAALLHERDAYQRKEQQHRLQNELKKDLDQQVSDKSMRKLKEREEDTEYFQKQIGEIEKWKEHEKNRVVDTKAKYQKEKEERDQQLNYCTAIKQAEAEKHLNEDRALLDKISQELDTERRLYDTRRAEHRKAMAKVWQGTMKDVNAKKSEKVLQQEEDTKQMHEYMNMLEEKEKKTARDIKNRLDAHTDFLNNIKAAGLQNEKDKEEAEVAKVATEQKNATIKAQQLEKKKREELKAMRLENQSYLFGQMKEKQDIKKQEEEEKLVQAKFLASDTAHFHEQERTKLVDKRVRNIEHRLELEKQISANVKPYPGLAVYKKSGTDSEANMSKCEVKMNKRLVAEVKSALATSP